MYNNITQLKFKIKPVILIAMYAIMPYRKCYINNWCEYVSSFLICMRLSGFDCVNCFY